MAGASCSSTEPREALARELLLAALEDLTQEQLKRFRHKLQDAQLDGRSIPRGRLERADPVDLVDKLTQFYGPEPALDVTRKILKKADARDVAARLKEQRLQRLGPSCSALLSVSEYKKKYREYVLLQHAKVKERNARSVKINKRFTKLLIASGSGALQEEGPGLEEQPEPERARRSDTHTFNRLFRGDEEGQQPLTVVLQGPAGIGKTMAAKKILYDWAAGKLYHGQVDFAFFVPCRELLERPGACSLADLILDQCPDRVAPVRQMLAHPQRLLFILDGADDLPALGAPEAAAPCTDPFEATSGLRLLSGLLSQELLPLVRLLVTTRALAPGRLQGKLSSPQCAEVRGFSNKDKKKYFFKFFKDEKKAERAYRFVKENETLFTLCFVPFVCWIVCTVLLQQLQLGQNLSRTSKTTTSVYLLFIVSTLKSPGADGPRVQGELRKLCLLAREGILKCQAHFSERDLERLKLQGSQVQTLFLSKKEVLGVLEKEVTYQFIDQSFQEFLAALSYLLEGEGVPGAPAGGVQMFLSNAELRGHLALTTRFLFGLLSTERIGDIEHHFGCVVPERVKQDTLQWVQGHCRSRVTPVEVARKLEDTEEPEEEDDEEKEIDFGLELLYCLYETQDDAFVRQALSSLPELVLERVRFSPMDLEVLSYCVRCCPAGQALRLVSCGLVAAQAKKKKSLVKRLQGSRAIMKQSPVSLLRPLCEAMTDKQCGLRSLTLSCCKLPDAVCRDLSDVLRVAPSLRELGLLQCRLTEAGLRLLSEGLAWPKCQVQTLRVCLPGLQEAIQYLVIVLRQSPVLTTLDLNGCQLPGPMVTYLCSALEHPSCCLKTLSLTSVELSELSLRELQAVKKAKPDLTIIHSAFGTHFQPPKECGSVF